MATFTQDASGQVTRMFGTVQDVTERREAEARLAESEPQGSGSRPADHRRT
jgi:PAS domain-containing protein